MKRCPSCNLILDDSNDFCLNDGTPLLPDIGAHVFGGFQSSGEMPTQFITRPQAANVNPAGSSANMLYLVIGILATALISIGVYAVFLRDMGKASDVTPSTSSQPLNSSNNSSSQSIQMNPTLNAANTMMSPPANSNQTPDKVQVPKLQPKSVTPPQPRPTSGTWFVVLGSYPKAEPGKANQRLRYVQGLGYQANMVDTDNYPGFRSGLWSIVVGPYSKSDAKGLAGQMKGSIPDAYIKSGW